MLRIAFLFVLLAIVAGVLGFGGMAGALSSLAVVAFYVFLALLALSLIATLFTGATHGGGGGVFGALVVAGLIGAGIYAWIDNGMTAQSVGASIDRGVMEARTNVESAAETAGDETRGFIERVDDAAEEAADGDGG